MTPLQTLPSRPRLTLWARLDPQEAAVVPQVPNAAVAVYALACPRCRRVFSVTDEQPVPLRRHAPAPDADAPSITIAGKVVCPYGCGASFTVRNGRVRWLDTSGHRAA